MLKKYMPYELLFEETIKRDYFLLTVEKDQNWKGGEMQVPFRGGKASSIAFGELTAEADITERLNVLGIVSDYKEVWGSLVFNDSDLSRHGDMEQSFLKILPDMLEEFVMSMKDIVSINLLNGTHIASCDVAGTAGADLSVGKVIIDRPQRLEIGQYIEIGVSGVAPAFAGYVKSIDMEDSSRLVEFALNKDLTGAVDFTVDPDGAGPLRALLAGDRCYVRGAISGTETFTSLPDQLLSAANTGSATLFGQTKLAYPHLQAQNFNGGTIGPANLLSKVFEFFNKTRQVGKGNPTDAIMSYTHLGSAMADLETSRDYTATDTKANKYGWTEINVVGVKGSLKIVGVPEMDDDKIHIIDWGAMKLHSNEFFERRENPQTGNAFYEVRSTTGYKYIVDTRFFGELVVSKPSHCGIIHSIP